MKIYILQRIGRDSRKRGKQGEAWRRWCEKQGPPLQLNPKRHTLRSLESFLRQTQAQDKHLRGGSTGRYVGEAMRAQLREELEGPTSRRQQKSTPTQGTATQGGEEARQEHERGLERKDPLHKGPGMASEEDLAAKGAPPRKACKSEEGPWNRGERWSASTEEAPWRKRPSRTETPDNQERKHATDRD